MNPDILFQYIESGFREVPACFIIGMLIVLCVGTVLFLVFWGGKKGVRWSAGLLLIEYLLFIIFLMLLFRDFPKSRSYNFSPFWSYRTIRTGNEQLLTQNIMNVVLFIPIGLLLGCIFGRIKWWKVLLFGGAFSIIIEILQFVLKRGFAEFDDVFHNVLGCMIGYGVYAGIAWLIKRVRHCE